MADATSHCILVNGHRLLNSLSSESEGGKGIKIDEI